MRLLGSIVLIGILIVAGVSVSPSSGQDQTEERLSALETRVADLEQAVFAQSTPEEATEAATGEQPTIGGNVLELLPPSEDGDVVLVASGHREGNTIPLVVRNNTLEPVADVKVKVEAHGPNGDLLAVGGVLPNHALKPYLLQPGDYAIGFAWLEGDLPSDAELAFTVSSSPAPGVMGNFNVDVVIDEVTWQSDRIVGVYGNPSDTSLGPTYMSVVCFSADGTPVQAEPATISDSTDVGGTTSFQISGAIGSCESFLIAGTAHPDWM